MKRLFQRLQATRLLTSLLFNFLICSLVCGRVLGMGLAAEGQTSAKGLSAAPSYKLISVKATGSKRFSQADIAAASGLPVGTIAHEDDFRKAARQLGESGAFNSIAFSFTYSSAGTKLEFQVTDADKFLPVGFTDFVWFTDEELRRKVHERIPLFNREVPASGRLTDEVSDVLQALLVENGIAGHVEYQRKTDKSEHPQEVDYNVAGVSIRIRRADFRGAGADQLAELQSVAGRVIDREYSREFMNSFVERSLLPVFRERGYLKAACGVPQPKVVKPAEARESNGPPATFVDVIFPVTPGTQYKLSGMEWSGNKEFATDALQALLHGRTGQPANMVQLTNDLKAVQELYGSHGYILAGIKVEAQFDDVAGTAALHLVVDEGSVYRMGELEFRGIDNNLTARLRAAWKIRPGEVYDATYLKQYLPEARKLLPVNLDWEVDPHVTAIARDKTVDVDLQYTAKAPR
ncbi:MAG TPA: POTRA domain-containing protein [Candidatus Acidoferrum sp.]|nr:POTRA domain-containing protein [Candidatus Acidoferrum sp.]